MQAQANFLLGADRVAVREEIARHRLSALQNFRQVYGRVKKAEKPYHKDPLHGSRPRPLHLFPSLVNLRYANISCKQSDYVMRRSLP